MEWEREEIVRDDFPTARRGYDPDAVRAHLEAVHERVSRPLSTTAGKRVSTIVETAERAAAEIEEETRNEAKQARREASEIRDQARREAARILSAAREQAKEHAERTQAALERLTKEADELRSSLVAVGREVTAEVGSQDTPPTSEPEPAGQQRGRRARSTDSPTPVPAGTEAGEGESESAGEGESETEGEESERPKAADARDMVERMTALDKAAAQNPPRRRWRRRGRS
jgi:cell division septum initiation protein DivIVA